MSRKGDYVTVRESSGNKVSGRTTESKAGVLDSPLSGGGRTTTVETSSGDRVTGREVSSRK